MASAKNDRAAPPELGGGMAEIDTSAPFESVREAVDRFGGSATWSSPRLIRRMFAPPHPKKQSEEIIQIVNIEEQTVQLEQDLIIKQKETLDVLKDLQSTMKIIADLKLRIQKESNEKSPADVKFDDQTEVHMAESKEQQPENVNMDMDMDGVNEHPQQISGSVLLELEQAKSNLNRTPSDLTAVRASIELLHNSIAKEKILLERGREKLSSNTTLISSLEDELDQTTQKLQTLKDLQERREDPSDIFIEIKKMASEVQQLRGIANASQSEAMMLAAKIEQTKASVGTAEVRCIAAKKWEEAARAAEALSLAKIKALLSSESSSEGGGTVSDGVTLSVEEYFALHLKAQEADENSRKKVEDAMLQVDVANSSETDSVKKLEDARVEVEECKKALQEALKRVEAANRGKLAVEEILRRWKCENGNKRQSISGSPKFKNAAHRRKNSHSMNITADVSTNSFRPTLSIGQILSIKLMGPDGYDKSIWDDKTSEEPNVSLGQILNRGRILCREDTAVGKRVSGKRKKFSLTGLSVLLAKQSKNKKKRESF
ncbi:hypothetical protein GUJ93_ZPchr0013g36252 [Zizania palustris]|uniref:WEB family protein n=1 Tax=Zizania palustris TaxID=103762 RepID=A0A8J5WWB5_ZIZPA|nr:hypothetical protein GUJ93_ZPchr0013g36252 [Zizania palustris]